MPNQQVIWVSLGTADLHRSRFTDLRKPLYVSFSIRHLHSISPAFCFRFSDLQPAPPVIVSQSHCCSNSGWFTSLTFTLTFTRNGAMLAWPLEGSRGRHHDPQVSSYPPGFQLPGFLGHVEVLLLGRRVGIPNRLCVMPVGIGCRDPLTF